MTNAYFKLLKQFIIHTFKRGKYIALVSVGIKRLNLFKKDKRRKEIAKAEQYNFHNL